MKIKDVMQTKVITIPMTMEITEIARTLYENNISGVPVIDVDGKLAGIVSEGDLLHKETNPRIPEAVGILGTLIYFRGIKQYESDFKKLMALEASEIMTSHIYTIDPEASVEEAADLMVKHKVKRLPVIQDGEIVGIISRMDIIKTLMID